MPSYPFHNSPIPRTFIDLLRLRAEGEGAETAYTFLRDGIGDSDRLTYGELDQRARIIAAHAQTVARPGSRALLLFTPGIDYIAAFFGCLYANLVAVPVYPPNPSRLDRSLPTLLAIAGNARPDVVMTSRHLAGVAGALSERAPHFGKMTWLTTDALDEGAARAWEAPNVHGDTVAFLQYTSGSTSTPKGVMVSHRNLMDNSGLIERSFGHSRDSRGVIWLPPYHDMGLIGGILQPLFAGFPVTLMSPVSFLQSPLRWLKAISDTRATTSGGPNFAYDLCVDRIGSDDREGLDLSCWQVAFNGAEPVRAETLTRFSEAFAPHGFRMEAFYPCYGLAETTLLCSGGAVGALPVVERFSPAALEENRATRVAADKEARVLVGSGRPMSGHDLAIVDPVTEQPCEDDRIGELWVRGPSIAQGYWGSTPLPQPLSPPGKGAYNPLGDQQPATGANIDRSFLATLPDRGDPPYLRTGDLGFLSGGNLFVTGRLKDLMIIRGRNHYPQDIERTVQASHPALKLAAGAAFTLDQDGEERLIIVHEVDRRNRHADPEAIVASIRQAVAEQHDLSVHAVVLLKPGHIPKTTSGKIQRHACRTAFVAGTLESIAVSVREHAAPNNSAFDITEDSLRALPHDARMELLEAALRAKIAAVLKIDVGAIDPALPITALGLDSLAAVTLRHDIEKSLAVVLPMTAFLEDTSLPALAERILALWESLGASGTRLGDATVAGLPEDKRTAALPHSGAESLPTPTHSLKGRESLGAAETTRDEALSHSGAEDHPLAFSQEQILFVDQLMPGSAVYNIPIAARLTGPLDVAHLESALGHVAARHEALRTIFVTGDGHPHAHVLPEMQMVNEDGTFLTQDAQASPCFSKPKHGTSLLKYALQIALPVIDISTVPEEDRGHERDRMVQEEARRPFDLSRGPLLRAKLMRLSSAADEHLLLLTVHHIVADGWSMGILLREIAAAYAALAAGTTPHLPEPPIAYRDYALRQREAMRGPASADLLTYWTDTLRAPLPATDLPSDRPRAGTRAFHGAVRKHILPDALMARILDIGKREGATFFMTLLTAFAVLVKRYTDQEDIVIGTRSNGRIHAETKDIIGFFVNALPLRIDLAGDPDFRTCLRRVRDVCLGAYAHQELPFDMLVEAVQPRRDISRHPLFTTMFVLQNFPMPEFVLDRGLAIQAEEVDNGTAKFDIDFSLRPSPAGLTVAVEYDTDLFDAATIDRMIGHYQTLLTGIADDARASAGLCELPMMGDDERRRILIDWNDTDRPDPFDRLLPEIFSDRAAASPHAVAIVCDNERLTYADLESRSNRLAHRLQSLGAGPDVPVGVCLERSPETVVALLAVLKAGAAYLPLDPAYPATQLAFMLADGQAPIVVTQQKWLGQIPAGGARIVCLDGNADAISSQPETPPVCHAGPDHLSHIMYTSGSTGRPKGVMAPQRQLLNRFRWLLGAYPFAPGEVACQRSSINFSVSLWEILGPLLAGTPLVIFPDETAKDPVRLIDDLATHRVSRIMLPPSLLRTLLDRDIDLPTRLPSLRYWTTAGEPLSADLLQRFRERAPHAVLLNDYGATEMHGVLAYDTRTHAAGSRGVPVGRPIDNTRVYLLDSRQQPVPAGVPAEIYVAGVGLARGYLNRPDLTARSFIPDPFSSSPGGRLYRTGDIARALGDGQIEYLGRRDHQVKIRGVRIEVEGIETVLREHPGVRQAAVSARADGSDGSRLIAYVVPHDGAALTVEDLRRFLLERMPEPVAPSRFFFLESLPLLPNKKIDRLSLPVPDEGRPELAIGYVPARTEMEDLIARIWSAALRVDKVGMHDNFFDLGGHSLLMAQVQAGLRGALELDVPLVALFQHPTVASLAQYLGAKDGVPGLGGQGVATSGASDFSGSRERAAGRLEAANRQRDRRRASTTR